jgi:hypothetical protein
LVRAPIRGPLRSRAGSRHHDGSEGGDEPSLPRDARSR